MTHDIDQPPEHDDIAANLAAVRARIDAACARAGRGPAGVTLVGVTKGHPPAAVAAAWRAGLRDFAENRVQEAAPKIADARTAGVDARWHLVGHLQMNKVTAALGLFDILHSVDSERLADAISRRAARSTPVLLEVNVADEPSKHGFTPAQALVSAGRIAAMPSLDVLGLMTVAPEVGNPEDVRPVFRRLRELRDALGLPALSMGMTDDFAVAVEEGATLVRVGRAIFGDRPPSFPLSNSLERGPGGEVPP